MVMGVKGTTAFAFPVMDNGWLLFMVRGVNATKFDALPVIVSAVELFTSIAENGGPVGDWVLPELLELFVVELDVFVEPLGD